MSLRQERMLLSIVVIMKTCYCRKVCAFLEDHVSSPGSRPRLAVAPVRYCRKILERRLLYVLVGEDKSFSEEVRA